MQRSRVPTVHTVVFFWLSFNITLFGESLCDVEVSSLKHCCGAWKLLGIASIQQQTPSLQSLGAVRAQVSFTHS